MIEHESNALKSGMNFLQPTQTRPDQTRLGQAIAIARIADFVENDFHFLPQNTRTQVTFPFNDAIFKFNLNKMHIQRVAEKKAQRATTQWWNCI